MSTEKKVFDFIKLPGTKTPYMPMRDVRISENWELLMSKTREEVEELLKEWEKADEHNKVVQGEVMEAYKEKMEEVQAFFKGLGIEIFKYKKKGYFTEKNGYVAWFEKNVHQPIKAYYPTSRPQYSPYGHMGRKLVQGVEVSNGQSPTPLLELYDRLSHQIKRAKEKEGKDLELYTKSVIYATEARLDVEGLSVKEVIGMVDEHAKESYLKEHFPTGKVIDHNACEYCSEYTMGERRCNCGNRRISVYVEGDIMNGFYEVVEPY